MMKLLIVFAFLFVLIFGVAITSAAPDFGGEGFYANCPGPVITMLDENEGGVIVYCTLWNRHCSDVVKIWDEGSPYIRIWCDNGKPIPTIPPQPPPGPAIKP
jgi:hypothetical protein